MNFTQANAIIELFNELRVETESRVPNTIDTGQKTWDNKPIEFSISKIDFEDMQITYSRYIGCGEYEYQTKPLNLEEIFGD